MVEERFGDKGVTLIELIMYIALMSIMITLIGGIFFTGSSIYEDVYSYTEIQQQSHIIMDFISDTVVHSEKIAYIHEEQNASIKENRGLEVREFGLRDRKLNEKENHIFSLQKDPKVEGKSLRYGRQSPVTIELGNYVDKIYLKTLPTEVQVQDAKGIKITLIMKKRGKTFEIFKKIYFRN